MDNAVIVREVWQHNVDKEFALIRTALPGSRFAAFDMEFPGHIITPQMESHLISRLHPSETYGLMKLNVDKLEIIQVGLSLSDSRGRLPRFGTPYGYVWQFNFRDFDLDTDAYNKESVALLKSQGIDFAKNREMGIDSRDFVKRLIMSGLIGSALGWITFHGSYDFGFMVKMLTRRPLPNNMLDFLTLVKHFFGCSFYDIKHMIKSCDGLHGGLERVAESLGVNRVAGKSHQAGSDSLLTLQTFFKLVTTPFSGITNYTALLRFSSVLFGLEAPMPWSCSALLLPPCFVQYNIHDMPSQV